MQEAQRVANEARIAAKHAGWPYARGIVETMPDGGIVFKLWVWKDRPEWMKDDETPMPETVPGWS